MPRLVWFAPAAAFVVVALTLSAPAADSEAPAGFLSLFNGKDFAGWKVPNGDNGHWKVKGGVIDYDARSEAKGDKNLWTQKSFRDFVLHVEWRLKTDKGYPNQVPVILPDGSHNREGGKEVRVEVEDVDSGIYL